MTHSEQQGERLDQVRKYLGMSQVKFAKRLQITQGYLNQVLKGRRNISHKILNAVAIQLPEINPGWLLNGTGQMVNVPVLPSVSEPAPEYQALRPIALQDLAQIILSMQAENSELRARLDDLEKEVQRIGKKCLP